MDTGWIIERLSDLGLSSEVIAMAQGMLLGDKSLIDASIIHSFRTSGMSHLLAVSGLHVGVIMSLVWFLLKPVEAVIGVCAPPTLKYYYCMGVAKRVSVIALTWLYVWLIGSPISAVRAALMLSLCLIGWMLHRPTSAWRCLILAALVLLALDPWCITQVGFQLSFLAVAGILLFQPWLQSASIRWWEKLVLLSVSAQWLTVPIIAYYFHQVPLLGWIQGLLVVPIIPFFVSGLLLGAFLPSLHCLVMPIEALYGWISWVAQFIVRCEMMLLGGHLYFYPSWWEALMAEVLLLAVILYLRIRHSYHSQSSLQQSSELLHTTE